MFMIHCLPCPTRKYGIVKRFAELMIPVFKSYFSTYIFLTSLPYAQGRTEYEGDGYGPTQHCEVVLHTQHNTQVPDIQHCEVVLNTQHTIQVPDLQNYEVVFHTQHNTQYLAYTIMR